MLRSFVLQLDVWDDNWTAVAQSLANSVQFEHTILVGEERVEVLTNYPEDESFPTGVVVPSSKYL